jgi:hypothetical protein
MQNVTKVVGSCVKVAVLLFVLAAAVAYLAGCEFTAADENGKQRAAQEWEERAERVRRQAEADTAAAIKAKDAEVARVIAEAKAVEESEKFAAITRRKRFDAAVAKVQAAAGVEVADLAAVYDQNETEAAAKLAATVATLNARVGELDRATAARIDQNTATVTEASAQTEAALKTIEEKQARILGGIKLAEGAAATFGGPLGGALAAVLGTGGIGGLLFGAAQRKRAANVEAEKNRRETITKDVLLALDMLKEKDPGFAALLKANKGTLDKWMGTDGVNLVNELTA